MHELSIARSILDQVTSAAGLEPGERYLAIRLRVGEVSGVEADALRFGLQVLARDRGWTDVDFDIERTPVRRRCEVCGSEFIPPVRDPRCPHCGNRRTTLSGGDELEIASVDVATAHVDS